MAASLQSHALSSRASHALSSKARHVRQPTACTRPRWYHHSEICTDVRGLVPMASTTRAGPGARSLTAAAAAAAAAAGAAGAQQPFPVGSTAAWWPAGNAVYQLYDAINKRNVSQLSACFAADVQYQNLALVEAFTGATAVAGFYQDSLQALPAGAEIVLEQHAGSQQQPATAGSSSSMAVVWRLVLPESGATVSRGIAFFCLDPSGHITRILDSPEHPVKLSARGLTVFGPLVQGFAGPMIPVVQDLGRVMQQGVDMLLQPLEALVSQQDGSTVSGSNSWPPGGSNSSSNSSSNGSSGGSSTPPQASSLSSTSRPLQPAAAAAAAALAGGGPAPGATAPDAAATLAQQAQAIRRTPAASWQLAAAAAAGSVGANGPDDEQQQQKQQQQSPNFSGLWVKVPERSDTAGYEAALDVLGLSGLQKVTARLIDGIEIQQSSTKFIVNFVTVVPFFKVTEDVPLDGGNTQLGRRDLRFGRQMTAAKSVPGGVLVEMSWGAPVAGTLTERYTLLEDGCMCVEADTRVGDKAANSKTVYQRTNSSRDEVLSQSKQRNPSVGAVLQKQRQEGLDV